MDRKRFLVKAKGDDREAARTGLKKLLGLMGAPKNGVIVVPNLKDLQYSLLTDLLSEKMVKQLLKDRSISFADGNELQLCSDKTLIGRSDVYLALWGTAKLVEKIEQLPDWTSLVLVTWIPEDATAWVQANADVEVIYGSAAPKDEEADDE